MHGGQGMLFLQLDDPGLQGEPSWVPENLFPVDIMEEPEGWLLVERDGCSIVIRAYNKAQQFKPGLAARLHHHSGYLMPGLQHNLYPPSHDKQLREACRHETAVWGPYMLYKLPGVKFSHTRRLIGPGGTPPRSLGVPIVRPLAQGVPPRPLKSKCVMPLSKFVMPLRSAMPVKAPCV
jgi:hypothetical protein